LISRALKQRSFTLSSSHVAALRVHVVAAIIIIRTVVLKRPIVVAVERKDILQEYVAAVGRHGSRLVYLSSILSVDPGDELDSQEELELKDQEVYSLFNMSGAGTNPLKVTVCANDADLTMEVDTGALESVISETTYYSVWPDHCRPPLLPSNAVLRCYSGQLKVSGRIEVTVCYGDQCRKFKILVMPCDRPSLLGRDWLMELRLDWKQCIMCSLR